MSLLGGFKHFWVGGDALRGNLGSPDDFKGFLGSPPK